MAIVFPVHAGMSRVKEFREDPKFSVPRGCGDEPRE